MRRHVLGFTTALALGSQAVAQTPPAAPPAAATPAAHAWYVRPDAGGWMVCVKSYSGPQAKACAEALAKDIRDTYKTPAYLFERGSEEKRALEARRAKEIARQLAQQDEFRKQADKLREENALKGMEFLETPTKVRVPRVDSISEQWAVLVGGWADDVTARQALTTIRTWPAPKNTELMDQGFAVSGGPGAKKGETAYLNPYASAHVVPNPVAPRAESAESAETLKALFRMNEKEPLSALQVKKPYTLVVKSFHPSRKGLRDKDGEKSVVQKLFGGTGNDGQEMQACANQAGELCKSLRNPNFKPRPLEAYVLHTLYGSVVTVGGYDGPDDPAMAEMVRLVESVTFTVTRQDSGKSEFNVKMFDPPIPMAVPRKP